MRSDQVLDLFGRESCQDMKKVRVWNVKKKNQQSKGSFD